MPTKKPSHSHHETTTAQTKETVMSSSIEAAPAPATAHPIAAAPSPATTPASVGAVAAVAASPSVDPPPANANIPATPSGFTPATPGEFRGVVPRQAELAAMPQALTDMSKFSNFDPLFSGVGLTQTGVSQCLLMGSLWSTMRIATTEWDQYCVLQEGYAWRAIRATLLRLEQAFMLAAQANPQLVALYPGLSSLLGAKKVAAQKGASTRRLNKTAVANGEPANHGAVGKQRRRKAEKAALAKGAPATPVATAPVAAPVVQAAPVVAVVAPPDAVPAPATGVTNGVAH